MAVRPPISTTVRDFTCFRGTNSGPFLMSTNNTIFGPTPLLGRQFDNADPGFLSLFPSKSIPGAFNTPAGSAGLGWVAVEVRQENNLITCLLNGVAAAQYTNGTSFTSGTIMLGYQDAFPTVGDQNNFALFDNIRVEPIIAAPVTLLSPRISGNNFVFDFVSEPYVSYTVQLASMLAPSNWSFYTNVVGTGEPLASQCRGAWMDSLFGCRGRD